MLDTESEVDVEMDDSPLDDSSQLNQTIQQRRERVQQLLTERKACEAGLVQIAAQQKALATRQAEYQHALQRNETLRAAAMRDLDNLLQTQARLQALQQQAQAAAAQARAAYQARTPNAGRPGVTPTTVAPPAAQRPETGPRTLAVGTPVAPPRPRAAPAPAAQASDWDGGGTTVRAIPPSVVAGAAQSSDWSETTTVRPAPAQAPQAPRSAMQTLAADWGGATTISPAPAAAVGAAQASSDWNVATTARPMPPPTATPVAAPAATASASPWENAGPARPPVQPAGAKGPQDPQWDESYTSVRTIPGALGTAPVAAPAPGRPLVPGAAARVPAPPRPGAPAAPGPKGPPARPTAAQPVAAPPRPAPPAMRLAVNRSLRLPMAVEVDLHSDHNLYVGFSENISDGGLFVATPDPQPLGSTVQVTFTLPDHPEPISCDTTVQWTLNAVDTLYSSERVPGMGLRFTNLKDRDRDRLNTFLAMREPLFFTT